MNDRNKMAALIWRKTSVLIDAGVPLLKTLTIVTKEIPEDDPLRNVISGIAAMIESGSNLKEALAKYSELFPPSVIALVEVGELTGSLEKSMFKIAENYQNGTFSIGEPLVTESEMENVSLVPPAAGNDAPIIKFVNMVIFAAHKDGASDIHFEWVNGNMRIRYRIDGVLQDLQAPPMPMQQAIIGRLKIMAGMNVAEKRLPQDGRMQLNVSGTDLDCRVSTVPYVTGESVVIRILNKQHLLPGLDQIGFTAENRAKFTGWLKQPNGMIICAGPMGSGKTTLMYSCVKDLNKDGVKIVAVENPVEYMIEGVNQLQVRQDLGLTFQCALRAVLRQAPNIIMIGEIRDKDTADLGVQASLAGHLVLTTLHTNDAPTAVSRLIDMGIEPYLVSSSLLGVCSQRLVRKICTECREEYKPGDSLLEMAKAGSGMKFYCGKGCPACHNTGYRGRLAIHEMLDMNDKLRAVLSHDPELETIRKCARDSGMLTLQEDGLAKVGQGITTVDEVLRVIQGV